MLLCICADFIILWLNRKASDYYEENTNCNGNVLSEIYITVKKHGTCIYTPTCSQYAIEAIQKYGACKGGIMAIWRILRCNPFAKGGYDPVP